MVNVEVKQRARFLAALAALGVTLVLVDRVIPRAGTIIAGGVFFWWIMQSGGADYLVNRANRLIGGLT